MASSVGEQRTDASVCAGTSHTVDRTTGLVSACLVLSTSTHVAPKMCNLQGVAELVLRADTPFNYCVIDEVDSILVDEARTPLIISGPADKPSDKYFKVRGAPGAI